MRDDDHHHHHHHQQHHTTDNNNDNIVAIIIVRTLLTLAKVAVCIQNKGYEASLGRDKSTPSFPTRTPRPSRYRGERRELPVLRRSLRCYRGARGRSRLAAKASRA
jgi:hypothetical protein